MFKKLFCIVLIISLCASVMSFASCKKEDEPVRLEIATTTADLLGTEGYMTDEEAIRGLYEAGFKYIDLSMYTTLTPDSLYMQEDWRTAVLELKEVADELGMKFVQAHSPNGNPLNSAELEDLLAKTIRSIEICGVLGIENIIVHAGWQDGLTKDQWFEANKAFYNKLLPTAEKCGVNILCENSTSSNMGFMYYIYTGADMREFIEYVDHPNFHGCWDTGHANVEMDDQYEDIVALGDEMYAIHYVDNMGKADTHLMPYFGTMNPEPIMKALQAINYKGYFTLECTGEKRAKGVWLGPEIPALEDVDLRSMTRIEEERMLYDIAEYILNTYDMLAK